MHHINKIGPPRGYFPSPAKSILITRPVDRSAAEAKLHRHNFVYKEGSRYLGSFVGDTSQRDEWLDDKIDGFVSSIRLLAGAAKRYPQTSYAAMTRSLQMEWQYMLRVLPDVAIHFERVEKALEEEFLPALFDLDAKESITEEFRTLTTLAARNGGIGLPNPSQLATEMHQASRDITWPLVEKLRELDPLDVDAYLKHATLQTQESRHKRDAAQEGVFNTLKANTNDSFKKRMMNRSRLTGGWMTAFPSRLNDTELSKEEFRDNLCLRYGIKAKHLPTQCDGCGKAFDVAHALSCSHGGMIHRRHDDVSFEWACLCRQALQPTAVSSEPFIYTGRTTTNGKANVDKDGFPVGKPDDRGDVAVHNFWQRGYTCIFDVRVTDTDQPSYRKTNPETVLQRQAEGKKAKYLDACLERRRHFTPLVFSVDGMRGREATAATKRLAALLSGKWRRGYNQCIQFVRSRLSISLARNITMCLRGQRDHGLRRLQVNWGEGEGALPLYLM